MHGRAIWGITVTVVIFACGPAADDGGEGGAQADASSTGAGGSGTESESEAGESESETGESEPIPGCECIEPESEGKQDSTEAPTLPGCGSSLCGPLELTQDEGPPTMISDPEALACALTALRDRTPGYIEYRFTDIGLSYGYSAYVLIEADGRGIQRTWGYNDLSFNVSPARLGPLAAPGELDACIQDPVDVSCLLDPLVSEDAICDGGWEGENF